MQKISSANLPLNHIGCTTQKQGKFVVKGPRMPG